MSGLTAETVRNAREAAGWSIADAVRELRRRASIPLPAHDSLVRSWKRWEAGTAPSRFYAPLLVGVLGLDDSAPNQGGTADVSGDWWAAWESSRDGWSLVAVQPARLTQRAEAIQWSALRRGRPIEEGGYLWRGELTLWDNEILMGWYAAVDGSVRSKGTVYLVLHPQGQRATGRWVGLSWDGRTATGQGALARTEADVRAVMDDLTDAGS